MMVVVDIEPGIEMDLAEFKNDLEESQSITISPYAEETVFEETYRFESMLFLKTVTGYTIVLKLSDQNGDTFDYGIFNVVDVDETGTDDGRNGVKIRTYSRWYFDCVDLKALEREKYHEKFRAELPEDKIEYIYKHRVTINFR